MSTNDYSDNANNFLFFMYAKAIGKEIGLLSSVCVKKMF